MSQREKERKELILLEKKLLFFVPLLLRFFALKLPQIFLSLCASAPLRQTLNTSTIANDLTPRLA